MKRARRVVVAGASGFIGQRTCAALHAANHIAIDLPRADVAAIVEEGPAGGPRTRRIVDALAGEAELLVWAAGKRAPDRAANLAIHADAPVACARALGVARVIYLSSGEVYGTAPLPYREDGPAHGTSDYAIAKLAGEARLAAVVPTTTLRLALVYGPGSTPPMLIPRLVAALRAGERFPMTHGEQTRDLVFVDDVAAAIVRAVEVATPTTVNIASGIEVRIRAVAEGIADAIATATGRDAGAVRGLLGFGDVALRPDEAHRYVMDVSRARAELGWSATTTLAEGYARL